MDRRRGGNGGAFDWGFNGVMTDRVKSLLLAMEFGTILPMPHMDGVNQDTLSRSMGFFPVTGLALGLILWGFMWTGTHFLTEDATAILGLGVYVLATGALHLDGLSDTFDAFGSRRPPKEALAVMKDSRIGTMGAAALAIVLIGKAVAFAKMPVSGPGPWVVVPVLARTSVVWCMAWSSPARPDGLGALYSRRLSYKTVGGVTVVSLALAAWLLPWYQALIAVMLCMMATVIWVFLTRRRFGGATGDTYGALLELVEWVGFLVLAGGWGYGR